MTAGSSEQGHRVFAFGVGPNAIPVQGVNRGYRSMDVVGRPPVDARLFEVARESLVAMFQSLK